MSKYNNDQKKSVFLQLKKIIEKEDVKHYYVAKILDIDKSTISKWFNNKRLPTDEQVEKIYIFTADKVSDYSYLDMVENIEKNKKNQSIDSSTTDKTETIEETSAVENEQMNKVIESTPTIEEEIQIIEVHKDFGCIDSKKDNNIKNIGILQDLVIFPLMMYIYHVIAAFGKNNTKEQILNSKSRIVKSIILQIVLYAILFLMSLEFINVIRKELLLFVLYCDAVCRFVGFLEYRKIKKEVNFGV